MSMDLFVKKKDDRRKVENCVHYQLVQTDLSSDLSCVVYCPMRLWSGCPTIVPDMEFLPPNSLQLFLLVYAFSVVCCNTTVDVFW